MKVISRGILFYPDQPRFLGCTKPVSDIWLMKSLRFIGILGFCLISLGEPLFSQGYFRLLEKPERSYQKKLSRFRNGDILIAETSLNGLNTELERGICLSRMDKCGNLVWAKKYRWKQNYLELKDLEINENGDILLYGSAYEAFDEFIFLLKLDKSGEIDRFRLFQGGTVDHFTFSIDWQNGRIMAYGLLLGWTTQKHGFLSIFDDDLNFLAGRVFAPFESVGDAVFTEDGGFLCRSGPYLVKLDDQGELQWANTLKTDLGSFPVAGPFELADGYLFEFHHDDHSFFYKMDLNGQLAWKSARFPSTRFAADVEVLPDGNLFVVYNHPGAGESYPCFLVLSPAGTVQEQKRLDIPHTFHSAALRLSVDEERNVVHLLGNADLYTAPADEPGFLMQFPFDFISGECFAWEPFQTWTTNDINIGFSPLEPDISELKMTRVDAVILSEPFTPDFQEFCELSATHIVREDSLLLCGESWRVVLPAPGVHWEDGYTGSSRQLDFPGVYRASNNNCLFPVTYEYELLKEPCDCTVYLPNAFSPNDDGQNDRFEAFSNCVFRQLRMTVYNRWGEKVFESDAPDAYWTGFFKQKPAQPGVYIVSIQYELSDETGHFQEGTLVQDLMLWR